MTHAVVLDAAVIVNGLFNLGRHPFLEELLVADNSQIYVPQVCDLEVVSALRKLIRSGAEGASRVDAALREYLLLPLERCDHTQLLARVFAMRDNFTPYDAAYVALAEALDVPLYTADKRLARAVRIHTHVEILEG